MPAGVIHRDYDGRRFPPARFLYVSPAAASMTA